MKNCLILGSGRSGTSMMGGIMHDAGYYMGEGLYPGRDSNPKGFFENAEINGLNEKILSHYDSFTGKVMKKLLNKSSIYAPDEGQRWLMSIEKSKDINFMDKGIEERIKKAISHQGFCYKDPRFSYTLPVWEKFLPKDTKLIVMFRSPGTTVNSILKECSSVKYLSNLEIDKEKAEKSWVNVYQHIQTNYEKNPEKFLFLHYEQVYTGEGMKKLSNFLNTELKNNFVEKDLKRSKDIESISQEAQKVYEWLCEKAAYES